MSEEIGGEVRVDTLTGHKIVFAPARAGRPGAFPPLPAAPPLDLAADPFAPGHEEQTPPELARVEGPGGWRARAFENRYPALTADAEAPAREASLDLFSSAAARGHHEVIVSSDRPVSALGALEPEELAAAMGLWRERIAVHAEQVAYVHLHVNEGADGGASQARSHAQLWALDFVPAAVARERERAAAYAVRTQGSDLLGDLVQSEVRKRDRLVAYDDEAVLLAPYASRVPFQLMLVPRTPAPRFEAADGVLGAALLLRGLRALAAHLGASPPLTLWVRTAPRGAQHFCWRIDVLPRLFPLGGLELGTGVHLNPVLPETAAAALKPLAKAPA